MAVSPLARPPARPMNVLQRSHIFSSRAVDHKSHHRSHLVFHHSNRSSTTQISSTRGKYADLLQGSKPAQDEMRWSVATVIENIGASADGSVRTLVLSVEDAVTYGDGRRVRHVQENTRWLDEYKFPGQFVAIRYEKTGTMDDGERYKDNSSSSNGGTAPPINDSATLSSSEPIVAKHLLALSSSPYVSRSASATLDAAIVEILVSRHGGEDEAALAELAPGARFHVSEVIGRGFSSLFNSIVGLQSCLEEGRPLLMVAVGSRGIAPLRAALAWTPVLAHATQHPINLVYAAESQSSAAYLLEWDSWREAGVGVHPIYVGDITRNGNASGAATGTAAGSAHVLALGEALEIALFGGERGLVGALGGADPREAAVVMSGVPGDVAAHLTRRLTHGGVQSERLLFCDFF
ncbi:hypothetical protein NADE_002642 [Nannochloris sp. 'desiccata']|nr:hypothetical protein KSW81_005642 [Chlorella desiccata (nom. nud.)]KAH7623453.1 hypothetical protein NADE_002642 [Chlorella desiccata (nom. nud.)]